MCNDVELQIGPLKLYFQSIDAPDEFARVANVVLSPVIWKDVKRILITVRSRVFPVTVTITGIATQCFKQVSVNVNFRQYARELHSLDDFSGHEIIAICRKVRT